MHVNVGGECGMSCGIGYGRWIEKWVREEMKNIELSNE
jgi:hypothetical protein